MAQLAAVFLVSLEYSGGQHRVRSNQVRVKLYGHSQVKSTVSLVRLVGLGEMQETSR